MGGLLAPLGEMIAKGLEKDDSLAAKGLSLAGNKEWELNLNPEGQAIGKMLSEYNRIKTVSLKSSIENTKAIQEWHSSSDAIRNQFPLEKSTIDQFHSHAIATQSPVAKITGQIIQNDPTDGALTLDKYMLKSRAKARLDAISGSVGDKMQNVSPLIASMLEHPDPRINMNGKRIADIVSNELKDTRLNRSNNLESGAKADMNRTFSVVNKARKAAGDESQIPKLRTDPTYYAPENAERNASSFIRMMQIPLVAIPHIGQYFHIPADSPLQAIGKALLQMDKPEMTKTLEASGVLNNTQWDVIHSDIAARTGKIAKWTNSPTAASIIAKSIHQPLFNWFRLKQLSAAGAVGFHSAIFWAENAMKGDKRALAELNEMGIDPADVIRQRGKLNEAQLAKGVYHYVNNRFFFDRSIDNSLLQNKNFFLRSIFMYHSFVNSEASYISRTLRKFASAGDYKGIAQYAGTLGIVFPAVAPMLKSLEVFGRTGSASQAMQGIQDDYKKLSHPFDDPVAFGATYLEMLAHIGAMGAFYNYTNAIKGHRLANAIIGPVVGPAVTGAEDIFAAATGKSAKPLGRDILQDTIPVAGKPLSHQLFPTLKEEGTSSSTHHSHSHRIRR